MRELIGKIGKLCENHVEKIVLAIAGIISAWLLFTGVVFSPDVVQYENKSFTPGQIDEYVAKKIDKLRGAMDRVTNRTDETAYVPRLTGPVEPNDRVMSVLGNRPQPESFVALLQSPLSYLGSAAAASQPLVATPATAVAKYRLPAVPRLTDVAVDYLRASAYVPLGDVTLERPYAGGQTQVDDIDLVTVEAKFKIADLWQQFRAYFNGPEVQKEQWRDPSLAEPKFAALQLERQEILDNGLWSDWKSVPPSRVCPYKQLFQVIENARDLPTGGIAIRMARYDNMLITMALLQPESYQIASADEQWYPPSFHASFKRLQQQVEQDEKRKKSEDARNQANMAATTTTTTTTTRRGDNTRGGTTPQGGRGTTTARGGRGEGTTGDTGYGGGRTGGRGTTTGRGGRGDTATDTQTGRGTGRGNRGTTNNPYPQANDSQNLTNQGPSTAQVAIDFLNSQIVAPTSQTTGTNLATLKEPLLVWALDDTVEAGKTYRYRLRIGVFNPVAGTGHVDDRDSAKKDQVILWSDPSQVTPAISIRKKVYFFAKDVQDRTMTASFEVARYLRGYWRTTDKDFQVRPGDTIGKEIETQKERKDKKTTADATGRITGAGVRPEDLMTMGDRPLGLGVTATEPGDDMTPPKVDFSTNALLVDLVEVSDWGGVSGVHPRTYYDVLYTEDGTRIEHMPANSRNWPKWLSDAYQEIKVNALKDKKPLRPFGQVRSSGVDRNSPYPPYSPYPPTRGR